MPTKARSRSKTTAPGAPGSWDGAGSPAGAASVGPAGARSFERGAGSGLPGAEIYELVVDATSPSRLFAATAEGLFRSTDGGGSWARTADGIDGDDVAAVAVDTASGTVFAGTFKGIFRSSDGGVTWKAFTDGLRNRDVRALAVAGSPPRLWAGTAGGSVYSTAMTVAVEAGE